MIKSELIKKHQVESLKSFECITPLTNQCTKLQYFTGPNFILAKIEKPIRVHRDFIPYLEETDRVAASCGVTVVATSSFRSTVIGCKDGAGSKPSPNGMHFVGFAVDFNLDKKDKVRCDKHCLNGTNKPIPEWTKCFTRDILKIKGLFGNMRYGDAFKDPGHFDVNINDKDKNLQLYLSIKNSIKDCDQI